MHWAIAIHGGASHIPEDIDPEHRAAYEAALSAALQIGRDVLASGGTAVDAVERTIRALEDDPMFNAGRGAVLTIDGVAELDASIMDGVTGDGGGVAGVRRLRHPISAARAVMEQTDHVLFTRQGAERLAASVGLERVEPSFFHTDWALRDVKNQRKARGMPPLSIQTPRDPQGPTPAQALPGETVGCVALDQQGRLAAGTSTGGWNTKPVGRVGDSPIIGAGTFADRRVAVSCTGHGEKFILNSIAARVGWLVGSGRTAEAAVSHCLTEVLPPGAGGIIAVTADGQVTLRATTPALPRGRADATGVFEVAIWDLP